MSLYRMTTRRVKKVVAWLLTLAIIGLMVAGAFYVFTML